MMTVEMIMCGLLGGIFGQLLVANHRLYEVLSEIRKGRS